LLCGSAWAQDGHTIAPVFPESFKIHMDMVNDDVEESMGEKETQHIDMGVDAVIARKDAGFKATYRINSFKMQTTGPDGKPKISAVEAAMIEGLLKGVGVAEVTLDKNLRATRVDNIEAIKASLNALSSLPGADKNSEDAAELNVLQLMVKDMTPESAADLISKGQKSGNYFNIPMVLNQTIQLPQETVTLMGTPFRTSSRMTLIGWEEGKAARLRFDHTPLKEDLDVFVAGIVKTIFAQMVEKEDAETKAAMTRLGEHVTMTLSETCEVEVSLVNYIDTRGTCDEKVAMTMDMKYIFPEETLKKTPEVGANMPVITMTENSKKVTATKLVK
jgi:hypothetical protein